MMSRPGGILILGSYRQTITVIRSLGRAGYHVIAGRGKARDFTEFSRYTAETWVHPDLHDDEDGLVIAVAKLLSERRDVRFVFPVGERQITYLAKRVGYIPGGVSLVMADPAVLAACFDKARTYAIAGKLGIPAPEYRKVFGYPDLAAAVEFFGYPCIVKPDHSLTPFRNMKAIIVNGPDGLRQQLPDWPQGNEFLLVQAFASGYRHNCQFAAQKGELLSYFEQRVLRTDRPNYTGYGVDGISVAPRARLKAYCESLVKELDYTGVGCVQFLVDDVGGTANLLELNPRLDATCAIPYYCGYDFPKMAVELAGNTQRASSSVAAWPTMYPSGKRGVWWLGDVEGAIDAFGRGEIGLLGIAQWFGRFLRSAVRADFHLTWSWRDPLPTLFLCRRFASSLLRRLLR
jgi:predicted ATP-grasp superfamily ATP-dependent carboligase